MPIDPTNNADDRLTVTLLWRRPTIATMVDNTAIARWTREHRTAFLMSSYDSSLLTKYKEYGLRLHPPVLDFRHLPAFPLL
jgi:hypothetical protein